MFKQALIGLLAIIATLLLLLLAQLADIHRARSAPECPPPNPRVYCDEHMEVSCYVDLANQCHPLMLRKPK